MPGLKIGISVAAKPERAESKKKPYTQKQYDAVLAFFQKNTGKLATVSEVDEGAEIESPKTTQVIIDAQVADPKTGVIEEKGRYGILASYTQEQYDAVLKLFRDNVGRFYSVVEITEEAGILLTLVQAQAIVDVQVADSETGVQQDPKSGKYGIPKKGKK